MSQKYFQHGATLWDFCVILLRKKDDICSPADLSDSRRKIRADTRDTRR